MQDDKNIEDWLMSLTPAERDKLPDDQRQRVIDLQRKMRPFIYGLFVVQLALIVLIGSLLKLAQAYYPTSLAYLSQFLSEHRLAQIGTALILVSGSLLYLVRQKWRLTYGLLEVAFATVYGFFSLQKIGGAKGYVETVSVVASVYLVVRGIDNVVIGLKSRQERIVQGRQQLSDFIKPGKEYAP
jgi:hypothetical protein